MLAGCALLCACAPAVKKYGPGPSDPQADRVVIEKSLHRMTLYRNNMPWHEYRVALGQGGLAPKEQKGDGRTPEGLYYVAFRNPESRYHYSLGLNYPNEQDIARARALGVEPGNQIMIHGLSARMRPRGPEHVLQDWTQGCIAVSDPEIEDIWNTVADGTPVEIRP